MIMMFPLVLCWLMVVSYSYELHTDTEPLRVQTEVHSQTGNTLLSHDAIGGSHDPSSGSGSGDDAMIAEELPSPSVPTLTFYNLSTVIISWQYGSHDPTCFLIEYMNNTRTSNVTSLICDNTSYVFPWLLRGQQYKFRVYATNNVSWSRPGSWTDLFINGIDAPPGPPPDFRADVVSDDSITLRWESSIVTELIYEICNGTSPVCEDPLRIFSSTVVVLPHLNSSTTYYFRIRSSFGNFSSVWSSWISVTTKLPSPSVPTLTFYNLSTVIISWQYGSHDPTCFLIEYMNNTRTSNVTSLICDNTSYVFPWLLRGQQYKFRVYATNNVSWSRPGSWTDLFINGIDVPPGPPPDFRADVLTMNNITLTWGPSLVTNLVYEICHGTKPVCSGSEFVAYNTNIWPLSGLHPSTTYYFRIRSSFGDFYSVWSPWIHATTYPAEDIQPVIIKKDTLVTTSHWVHMEWQSAQTKPQYTLREYYVDVIVGLVKTFSTPVQHNYTLHDTTLNITSLTPHTNYTIVVGYSVTTNNEAVINSPLSDPLYVMTPLADHVPVVNCSQCRAVSKDELQISWKPASLLDGNLTTEFIVYQLAGGQQIELATVNRFTLLYNITGLHPNHLYTFGVRPLGMEVNGSITVCPEDCRTKEDMPSGPPTNVRVAVLSASSVNVTWDDPLPDKRNGVIRKFTISYDCSDDNNNNTCPDYAPITSKEKHYQIINGLHPYTEYLFAVAARTEIGEGPFSFAVYVMTLEAAPSAAPGSLTLFQSLPTLITFQWTPPGRSDQNGVIIGYQVTWRLLSGDELGTINVTSTSVTIPNLHVNTSYQVAVSAFTAAGIGPKAETNGRTLDSNYNLHFTAKLVQSDVKGCQDIELNWNTLPISNIHYTIDVFIEEEGVIWNRTTDGGHVLLSHQDLRAGVKYGLELEVIVDINKDTSLSLGDIPSQLLNITTPSCSKPNDLTVLFTGVGIAVGVLVGLLMCICCVYWYRRWRFKKLLGRVRNPVGEDKAAEEEMRQADEWSCTNSDTSDVPLLASSHGSTDTIAEDITLLERPLPLGAENS